MGISCSSTVPPERSVHSSGMYKLEIELKRGHNLAVRDRGGGLIPVWKRLLHSFLNKDTDTYFFFFFPIGSSDPYVKFKLAGKEVFRSKTIHRNLNPVWDERTTVVLDSLSEPLYVKVRSHLGARAGFAISRTARKLVLKSFLWLFHRCLTTTLAFKMTSWVPLTSTWSLWSSRGKIIYQSVSWTAFVLHLLYK